MGYCCGGIETPPTTLRAIQKKDHMGYCCGGIETLILLRLVPKRTTTWVTAAAVLRLFS